MVPDRLPNRHPNRSVADAIPIPVSPTLARAHRPRTALGLFCGAIRDRPHELGRRHRIRPIRQPGERSPDGDPGARDQPGLRRPRVRPWSEGRGERRDGPPGVRARGRGSPGDDAPDGSRAGIEATPPSLDRPGLARPVGRSAGHDRCRPGAVRRPLRDGQGGRPDDADRHRRASRRARGLGPARGHICRLYRRRGRP